MKKRMSIEIKDSADLCTPSGKLNPMALGWSRRPLIRCNIHGHFLRKKKWNYWAFINQNCMFSATVSNIDYLGVVFCYFLDLKSGELIERTVLTPFGTGCNLPDVVNKDVEFNSKDMKIRFLRRDEKTFIESHFVAKGKRIEAHLEVLQENIESLNVVVPWNWNRYQFTSKQYCLPVRGKVFVSEKCYDFDPDNSFATLDFGRGVWRYLTFWNWANFATRLDDGTVIGVNLGAGWTDGTGTNENAVLINGKLSKIESDVRFVYDKTDLMKPWHIYSFNGDEVDIEFQPYFHRSAKTNLILLSSNVNQMVGTFKGFVRDGDRKVYIIRDALGWAEEHYARW